MTYDVFGGTLIVAQQLNVSIQLQSATPALTSGPLFARACHQDAGPGVHLVSLPELSLIMVKD